MAITYEPIATTTLSTATTTVTFSSISGSYTDLVYVIYNKSGATNLSLRFNSDTGSNYSSTQFYTDGSGGVAALQQTSTTRALAGVGGADSLITGNVMNYSNTTTNKTFITRGGGGGTYIDLTVSSYRSTSAITSISFQQDAASTDFQTGSTFTLYGIKAA